MATSVTTSNATVSAVKIPTVKIKVKKASTKITAPKVQVLSASKATTVPGVSTGTFYGKTDVSHPLS